MKDWYLSKGFWGSAVAVAAGVGGLFGLNIDVASATDILTTAGSLVGGVLALVGRIKADRPLRW